MNYVLLPHNSVAIIARVGDLITVGDMTPEFCLIHNNSNTNTIKQLGCFVVGWHGSSYATVIKSLKDYSGVKAEDVRIWRDPRPESEVIDELGGEVSSWWIRHVQTPSFKRHPKRVFSNPIFSKPLPLP